MECFIKCLDLEPSSVSMYKPMYSHSLNEVDPSSIERSYIYTMSLNVTDYYLLRSIQKNISNYLYYQVDGSLYFLSKR